MMTRDEVLDYCEQVGSICNWIHRRPLAQALIAHDAEQRAEIARLREALKSIVEGDWLWSASDMAHAAQQTLKELPCGDT